MKICVREFCKLFYFWGKCGTINAKEVDFMYTLFIDTHDELITVGLVSESKVLIKEQSSYHKHAVYLVPMVRNLLSENMLTVKDICNIVCVNGPGSFTGLRIGLTVGKVLAYSLGVPIYLISSLEAYLVSSEVSGKVLAVIKDTKGYYVRGGDVKEQYVTDLSEFSGYSVVLKKLDVRKVVNEALRKSSVNVHLVRANYVKEIEANKHD